MRNVWIFFHILIFYVLLIKQENNAVHNYITQR